MLVTLLANTIHWAAINYFITKYHRQLKVTKKQYHCKNEKLKSARESRKNYHRLSKFVENTRSSSSVKGKVKYKKKEQKEIRMSYTYRH